MNDCGDKSTSREFDKVYCYYHTKTNSCGNLQFQMNVNKISNDIRSGRCTSLACDHDKYIL